MKKRLISAVVIMALMICTYSVALADESTSQNATRNSLKSVGNVVYTDGENKVEIHSDDMYMLADKMDSFKECVADQLALCHTYFSSGSKGTSTVSDGDIKVVHTEPSEDDAVDPVALDFDTILEGIAASQSIPSDVTEYGYADGTALYKTESGKLTTDGTLANVEQIDISAATPENLSAGSAAWVNGKLILGTGADNDAYFQQKSGTKLSKFASYNGGSGINKTVSLTAGQEYFVINSGFQYRNESGGDVNLAIASVTPTNCTLTQLNKVGSIHVCLITDVLDEASVNFYWSNGWMTYHSYIIYTIN